MCMEPSLPPHTHTHAHPHIHTHKGLIKLLPFQGNVETIFSARHIKIVLISSHVCQKCAANYRIMTQMLRLGKLFTHLTLKTEREIVD